MKSKILAWFLWYTEAYYENVLLVYWDIYSNILYCLEWGPSVIKERTNV